MLLVFLEDQASITTIGWLTFSARDKRYSSWSRVSRTIQQVNDVFGIYSLDMRKCKSTRAIYFFIIWLQYYARSDWLLSSNDRALLARCPRDI